MSNFTEWLSKRNKNIFNELFEPNLQGVDQQTKNKSWLVSKGPKNSILDKEMIGIKDFLTTKTSDKLNAMMVELSTQGVAFLNRQDINMSEKIDKLGRALGNLFQKIDENYDGLLAFPPFSQDEREKDMYMKAISRIAGRYNLTGRLILNNKRLIVYSEKGKELHPHLFSPSSGNKF